MDQLLDEIMELFDESDKAIDETKQKQEEEVKKCRRDHWKLVKKVQRGMVMNNKEQNREKLELVERYGFPEGKDRN